MHFMYSLHLHIFPLHTASCLLLLLTACLIQAANPNGLQESLWQSAIYYENRDVHLMFC